MLLHVFSNYYENNIYNSINPDPIFPRFDDFLEESHYDVYIPLHYLFETRILNAY